MSGACAGRTIRVTSLHHPRWSAKAVRCCSGRRGGLLHAVVFPLTFATNAYLCIIDSVRSHPRSGNKVMMLLVNAGGHVTWDNTRQAVVASAKFAGGQDDYGAGIENQATCPGCGRTLPTKTMHLDHILAQARHAVKIMGADTEVTLLDSVHPHGTSKVFIGVVTGGTVSIYRLMQPEPASGSSGPIKKVRRSPREKPYPQLGGLVIVINTVAAWENDLENLQFLCMCCNTSKKDRSFDEVFPERAASAFASALA